MTTHRQPTHRRPAFAIGLASLLMFAACGSDGSVPSDAASDSAETSEAVSGGSVAETPDAVATTQTPSTQTPATQTPATQTPATQAPVPDDATAERRDRMATALVGDTDVITIGEAECIAAGVSTALSEKSFELLVRNLETINEIEEGTQFTDDELLAISWEFAACADFGDLVADVAGGLGNEALVDCVGNEIGVDELEAAVLFEVLGENGSDRGSPILLRGLDGACSTEARAVVDQAVLDLYLLEDQPPIVECLAGITNDELLPLVEQGSMRGLEDFIAERCDG